MLSSAAEAQHSLEVVQRTAAGVQRTAVEGEDGVQQAAYHQYDLA